ncbi:MAG: MucB/RseB C-terminal domain-containing protein [Gammaproteobacteria bacterium]|nr:MucB/RseB C-terminal domain-containing protein [Gammaproteobacteria bacterium]
MIRSSFSSTGRSLILCSVLIGVAVHADDEPREWLADMNRAFTELSYDGMFSFYSGDDLASLRVVHMIIDSVQRERLVHLNGAPREIVRIGEEVACILMPGDDLLELESSIPSGPFARAFVRRYDRISSYYGLSFFGEDRVAGRQAVRMAVLPRDEDRFGYRLWLDKQTRMLLRSELVDGEGNRLEIFQFNQIAFGDEVSEQALEPMGDDGSIVSHLSLARENSVPVPHGESRWRAEWVPAGFTMAASDIRSPPGSLDSVDTMMFSDGLAAFSVFIEDMPPAGAASMISRRGATVAVTHLVADSKQAHHLITLVGELPTLTAQRIAQSIKLRRQP